MIYLMVKVNSVIYEGEFINGKYEGIGKYYYDDGNYYIGQWKNSLRNGEGVLYIQDGRVIYEGEFFDDKFEGNGKYYYPDGKYYIGQFKKGLKHGIGI